MSRELSARLAMGFAAACVTATGLYGALRVLQFLVFPEPNPAQVIWSAHAGYFWRSWTVGYVGGMVGLGAFAWAGSQPAKVARALVPAVTIATLVLVVQTLFVP